MRSCFFIVCTRICRRSERTRSAEGKFSLPPSPSGSVEGATGEKRSSSESSPREEALAEAPVPHVQVLSSREGTLSARRGGAVTPVMGAKSEGALSQPSPCTPRTEEASPSAASLAPVSSIMQTPTRSTRRGGVGPFAFPPEAPMLVLPLAGLSAARCFPKFQNAMRSGALVPYDSLDRNSAFVVFVSHRWVNDSGRPTAFRQHGAAGGGDGMPDVDSAKHGFLVEGLNSILASLPREVAVFLWVDYSCIDQVRARVPIVESMLRGLNERHVSSSHVCWRRRLIFRRLQLTVFSLRLWVTSTSLFCWSLDSELHGRQQHGHFVCLHLRRRSADTRICGGELRVDGPYKSRLPSYFFLREHGTPETCGAGDTCRIALVNILLLSVLPVSCSRKLTAEPDV